MPSNWPTSDPRPAQSEGEGTLYVIATPIGNRDDITLRALATLRAVHLIAAEDTRLTGRFLHHHGIKTPLTAYHEYNEAARAPQLVAKLRQGISMALVSSAGTPMVSDPGYRLITTAIANRIRVVPLPGACAAVTALSAAGLPTDSFTFVGFPAKKAGRRKRQLAQLEGLPTTLIFYESPRRICTFLGELIGAWGNRQAVLTRELTKIHEEFLRGSLTEILGQLEERHEVRGECTLLVQGAATPEPLSEQKINKAILDLLDNGLKVSEISKRMAAEYDIPKKRVYDLALKIKPDVTKESEK